MQAALTGVLRGYADILRQVLRYSAGEQKLIAVSIVLTILASVTETFSFGLLIPIMESSQMLSGFADVPVLKWFSSLFVGFSQNQRLLLAASLLLVLTLIRGALLYISEIASYSIPWRVDARLRLKVYDCLHRASIGYVEGLSAAEQANITASNPARIGVALRFVALLAANIGIVVINMAMMMVVSPALTLSLLFVIAVLSLIYKRFTGSSLSQSGTRLTEATTQFSRAFYDTLNGMRVIRLSGSTGIAKGWVKDAIESMKAANLKVLAIQAVVGPYFVTAVGIIFCVILMSAAALGHAENSALLASMVATIYLMSRLLGPVTLINVSRAYIAANLDAFREMERFMAEVPRHFEPDGGIRLQDFQQEISFRGVTFLYQGREEPALKNLTLTIRKGEKVGIVGLSGSGKSTVVNLLTRLYRPSGGEIQVDGISLDALQIDSWWTQMAVVTQEMFFSHMTIRENLTQGLSATPTDDQIWNALYVADASGFVAELPNGLDTLLPDRGGGLSGGERQRLCLARAILRQAHLLILDEATSNLDVRTEAIILERLADKFPEITVLVIAHRVGAVQICDKIAVLGSGCIVRIVEKSKDISTGYPPLAELLSDDKSD